jgi:hypothetical protein
VVSVFATGPEAHRFKPGRGNGFLRAIKICSTSSSGWEVKPEACFCKILQYVKRTLHSMIEMLCWQNSRIFFATSLLYCWLSQVQPESAGG